MRTPRPCVLVCVVVACVALIALCVGLMVYADSRERGAWLVGLLFPCVLVICCAFTLCAYSSVHLICPQEEQEQEQGQEMAFVEEEENASLIDGAQNSIVVNREI